MTSSAIEPPRDLIARAREAGASAVCRSTTIAARFAALADGFRASVVRAPGASPTDDPAVRDGAFHFSLSFGSGKLDRRACSPIAAAPTRARRETITTPTCRRAMPMSRSISGCATIERDRRADPSAARTARSNGCPARRSRCRRTARPRRCSAPMPVIYPFIVNNPGEAAQAKRRIGAVTIGHLTPPLIASAAPWRRRANSKALFDEYAAGAGARSAPRARSSPTLILERAGETGLARGMRRPAAPTPTTALMQLDAWLCDLKDMRIGDGLHVFGRASARRRRSCGAKRR